MAHGYREGHERLFAHCFRRQENPFPVDTVNIEVDKVCPYQHGTVFATKINCLPYYVADMKQIHNKDEGLFAKEAEEGSAPFKRFAHQTAVLVNADLGWLNTL
jgi:hypothetical protein